MAMKRCCDRCDRVMDGEAFVSLSVSVQKMDAQGTPVGIDKDFKAEVCSYCAWDHVIVEDAYDDQVSWSGDFAWQKEQADG